MDWQIKVLRRCVKHSNMMFPLHLGSVLLFLSLLVFFFLSASHWLTVMPQKMSILETRVFMLTWQRSCAVHFMLFHISRLLFVVYTRQYVVNHKGRHVCTAEYTWLATASPSMMNDWHPDDKKREMLKERKRNVLNAAGAAGLTAGV